MAKDNCCLVPECRNKPDNIVGHFYLVVGCDFIRVYHFFRSRAYPAQQRGSLRRRLRESDDAMNTRIRENREASGRGDLPPVQLYLVQYRSCRPGVALFQTGSASGMFDAPGNN